jgi:WS/DGAT/MGAT family acyltransferase
MKMLSGLDATFLYLESEHSPMGIGGVYLINAADAPAGFAYASWHTLVGSRLQCSKVFRRRLVEVPWGLSHPYWINDPHFDLDVHLPSLALPEPGGKDELMELAADIWSRALDRDRPLWELNFVEGLNSVPGLSPGSWALITRVHHAAVDGGAATELMTALLDISPQPRRIEVEDDWEADALPSTLGMVSRSWGNIGRKAIDLASFAGKVVAGTARLQADKRILKLNPPPRLLSAPRSVFNGPVASRRMFWGVDFDFKRIKAIRPAVPGVTVNDVILSVCAGALRRYLSDAGLLPDKPLVAMAPISVRQEEQKGDEGNQVSAMLVDLATDLDHPMERLRRIHESTRSSKIHAGAMPANRITEFIPSETLAAAARVYTRTRLGGQHRPFFNLIITNVPGPPFPLYLAGARIGQSYAMAPILDGLGLILVIFSYAGRISIGITSCQDMVPEPEGLADCFEQSLTELEEAAAQLDPSAVAAEQKAAGVAVLEGEDPLGEFHKAERALDAAIESLREKNHEKST